MLFPQVKEVSDNPRSTITFLFLSRSICGLCLTPLCYSFLVPLLSLKREERRGKKGVTLWRPVLRDASTGHIGHHSSDSSFLYLGSRRVDSSPMWGREVGGDKKLETQIMIQFLCLPPTLFPFS